MSPFQMKNVEAAGRKYMDTTISMMLIIPYGNGLA